MVIIISLAPVAVILALCLVFYLVNGARIPIAGADPAVIRKAKRDHEQRWQALIKAEMRKGSDFALA